MEQHEPSRDTERREATILFTDVTGFTSRSEQLDPEEIYEIISPCMVFLDQIARKHGGAVDHYQGDAILATFGVPFAVEDAARAAINAAIEMHNRIDEYCREQGIEPRLRIHTGINSGLVASGPVSRLPINPEFSILGDTVNVAARLRDKAPADRIWVGSETHRYTSEVFEFRAVPPLELKGKREPMPCWEVLSRRPQLHRVRSGLSSVLVGRRSELERLEGVVAGLREGRGGIVRVVGTAGIGKSRLVEELASSGPSRDAQWLTGRCLSMGGSLSFHAFADLLRGWAEIPEDEGEREAFARFESRVEGLFGADTSDVLPLLATLAGFQLPRQHRARLEGVEGEALENLRLGALSRLLRRLAARGPLVVAFEDLHWADVSSLELLDPLLRLVADHPLLFLLVQRPDAPAPLGESLAAARERLPARYHELQLGPLDRGAAEELLDNLFRGGDLPHATRSLIEDRAGGNPFYLEEIVRALVEEGAIERREGALWATERLQASAIPGTVQEVVMARLDRLPPRSRNVLQCAAILGRASHSRVLAGVAEDAEHLEEDLALLTDAELLTRRERLEETVYEFKHPLIQEVAYEAISRKKRREAHLAVADVIEAELPDGHPGRSGMLAYHFSLGRDLERAEHYLVRAGEEAGRAAAPSEALHFLQEASQLYFELHGEGGDPLRKAGIEKQIAMAFFKRGRMVEGDQHFDAALRLLGEQLPAARWRRNLRYGTTLLTVLASLYLGRDPARRRAPDDRDRELIEMMFYRAQSQVTADAQRLFFDTMENLRQLNRVDPRTVEAAGGMYASAVVYFAYMGLALGIEERLLRLAASLVDPRDARERMLYQGMSYMHHFFRGDWDERHTVEPELIEENLRLGQLWYVVNYLPLDAKRRIHQGRFAEAAELLERISKIEDLYAYDLARSNRLAVTMFLRLEQRRLHEALAAAQEHYESFQEDLLNVLALGTRARIEVLLGEPDRAEETLARAASIVGRASLLPPFQLSEYLLARLALTLERLEAAREREDGSQLRPLRRLARRHARDALARATRVAWQRPETYRLVGRCNWLLGRERRALGSWRRSIEEAERLGMRPALGRTQLEVGRRLAGAGGGARFGELDAGACLDCAEKTFRELDLGWDLEQVRRAKDGLRSGSSA